MVEPSLHRILEIMRALDEVPRALTREERQTITAAIAHPLKWEWQQARGVKVTSPDAGHPAGMTLWQVLMLRYHPNAEQCTRTPTPDQILTGLRFARRYLDSKETKTA